MGIINVIIIQLNLLLVDVSAWQVDVDGVLVVYNSAHTRHWGVQQALLLIQGPLLLRLWERTGVGQEADVRHAKVPHTCRGRHAVWVYCLMCAVHIQEVEHDHVSISQPHYFCLCKMAI